MQARRTAHFATWRSVLCALSLSCILSGITSTAIAVPITYNYGSAAGSTVDFLGISETPTLASAPDQKAHFLAVDPSGLAGPFGVPTPSGNSLLFNPTTFSLTVAGSGNPLLPNSDILDSQLSFIIAAKSGYGIDGFAIHEVGDVFFSIGATKASWAQVAASIFVTVTEVDGKAISPISVPAANAIFIPTGAFNAASNPVHANWSGNGIVDIGSYLASQNILGTATRVSLTLDNTLYAGSGDATTKTSKIQKKLADGTAISVITTPGNPVPEPSSMVLAAIGIIGIGWYGRRNLRRS